MIYQFQNMLMLILFFLISLVEMEEKMTLALLQEETGGRVC